MSKEHLIGTLFFNYLCNRKTSEQIDILFNFNASRTTGNLRTKLYYELVNVPSILPHSRKFFKRGGT